MEQGDCNKTSHRLFIIPALHAAHQQSDFPPARADHTSFHTAGVYGIDIMVGLDHIAVQVAELWH